MQPHRDCFLEWQARRFLPKCVNLTEHDEAPAVAAKRRVMRDEFANAFGRNWVEIVAWGALAAPPAAGSARHRVVETKAIVDARPCCKTPHEPSCAANGDGICGPSANGHQCSVGTPNLIAVRLAAALNERLAAARATRRSRGAGGAPRRYIGAASNGSLPPWVWSDNCGSSCRAFASVYRGRYKCPAGRAIGSERECTSALDALGLPRTAVAVRVNSLVQASGCLYSHNRSGMIWNAHPVGGNGVRWEEPVCDWVGRGRSRNAGFWRGALGSKPTR